MKKRTQPAPIWSALSPWSRGVQAETTLIVAAGLGPGDDSREVWIFSRPGVLGGLLVATQLPFGVLVALPLLPLPLFVTLLSARICHGFDPWLARFMAVMAVAAVSAVSIVTKPKPRDWPLSRSMMTWASVTEPCASKAARSDSVVAPKERLPI